MRRKQDISLWSCVLTSQHHHKDGRNWREIWVIWLNCSQDESTSGVLVKGMLRLAETRFCARALVICCDFSVPIFVFVWKCLCKWADTHFAESHIWIFAYAPSLVRHIWPPSPLKQFHPGELPSCNTCIMLNSQTNQADACTVCKYQLL